jgi:hypothetical protein
MSKLPVKGGVVAFPTRSRGPLRAQSARLNRVCPANVMRMTVHDKQLSEICVFFHFPRVSPVSAFIGEN